MGDSGQNALSEQQKQNLRSILLKARVYTERHKREAGVGDAILIANREAEHEEYFRKQGVEI